YADGLVAALDVFGNIGDLGWVQLRKIAATPATGDTANTLPSGRTGIGSVQASDGSSQWVYVIGGTTALAPTAAMGAPFTPSTPVKDVFRARLLPAAESPTASAAAQATGTLAAGTYYYKVATLLVPNTPGYGTDPAIANNVAAETVASDEQVV